ncbi:MAG: hypothetical protein JNM81_02820 [Rhodospirillaceae bacterium]|nr:hypothetical protein [Rhodospirillaceae bacterium]
MTRPIIPSGFARRKLLTAATAMAVAGPDALLSSPARAHGADALAFRGAALGEYGVIRAQGFVIVSAGSRAGQWPVTETTLVSWTDCDSVLTEYRRRRLQVQIAGKILEQTQDETETIHRDSAQDVRVNAAGYRTLVLAKAMSPRTMLSEGDTDLVCASPATATLPAYLSALRVIQDGGFGSVKRVYVTERGCCNEAFGFSGAQSLLWRMAGTLTRWASDPVTNTLAA